MSSTAFSRPPEAAFREDRGVRVAIDGSLLSSSDVRELEFWSNDRGEGPDADLFENVIYKSRVMIVFRSLVDRLRIALGERILELGAGHGWASIIAKSEVPDAYVVTSDLSHDAIRNSAKYETLIGARIDEKWACSAVSLPFADGRFDLVFCFAAFHHFIIGSRYDAVLSEVHRVLKPGGRLVMLYEPSSPRFVYDVARRRTAGKRHLAGVDEDVILLDRLGRDAKGLGLDMKVEPHPEYRQRSGIAATVYYFVLSKVPFLQAILPCTVNVTLTKPH